MVGVEEGEGCGGVGGGGGIILCTFKPCFQINTFILEKEEKK